MAFDFTNFGNSALANGLTPSDTVGTLSLGTGALMPQLGDGNEFCARITDAATMTINEVVYVTSIAGDVITMTRGQEGTNAATWASGALFLHAPSAGALGQFLQRDQTALPQKPYLHNQPLSAGQSTSISATVACPVDGVWTAIGWVNILSAANAPFTATLTCSLSGDTDSDASTQTQIKGVSIGFTKGQAPVFTLSVNASGSLTGTIGVSIGMLVSFEPAT